MLLLFYKRIVQVLIDTWWNVNFTFMDWELLDTIVLIDTWWNVNKLVYTVQCTRNLF